MTIFKPIIVDLETTSLDPSISGRVTCISICNCDDGDKIISFYGADETKILSDFWNYIKELGTPTLVTFCGSSFDIPYLIHRSIVCSQKIYKYNHVDLRHIVNSFFTSYDKKIKGTLGYWASVLGYEQQTPPGCQMIELFMNEKYDEIKKHCEEDVLITRKLLERVMLCQLV